jgi:hypothetical protein
VTTVRSLVCFGVLAMLAEATLSCKGLERSAPARPLSSRAAVAKPTATPAASSSSPRPPASALPPAAALDGGPRIYAKTRFVWVYPEPDASKQWLGYLRTGGSVRLLSTRPRSGPGCAAFYEVEPRGFVCGDGPRATLDREDPIYRALLPFAAKTDTPWPHRYGESLGLVRYFNAPTPDLQRLREGERRSQRAEIEKARAGEVPASLVGVDLSVPDGAAPELPPLPVTVFEDRKELKRRSTVAYSAEARFGDRAFLLSSDFAWVPKDRVRPYPQVAFHGVELGAQIKLPLAFFRKNERRQFRRRGAGSFSAENESFPRLSRVQLTGASERADKDRFFETTLPDIWLRESDAVIPTPSATTPWGATVNAQDDSGRAPKGRASWIEVSIEGGWLLAYEGTRPVYVTLVSPGRGGLAQPGEDPLARGATPTGAYPISGKFVGSTMVAPGELIHSDVPFAQNIVGPYALHAAYWHDNWGNPQSGGCINLSPIDAKWMFGFTDPKLPDGWAGVRWVPEKGPATLVVLHR